jgi:hypothetical protein
MGRRDVYVAGMRATLARRGDSAAVAEIDRLNTSAGPEAVARWLAENPARVDPSNPEWSLKLNAAVAFMCAGDHDRALDTLETIPFNTELRRNLVLPNFDPVRDHPRFRALVERERLTAYHAKYLTPARTPPATSDAAGTPRDGASARR